MFSRVLFIISLFFGFTIYAENPVVSQITAPFHGKNGTIPSGWNLRMSSSFSSGLSNEFNFSGHTPVLRLRSKDKTTILTSDEFERPKGKTVLYSIWARATGEYATMRMLILGNRQKWARWNISRKIKLTDKWKKYTIKSDLPENLSLTIISGWNVELNQETMIF